MQQGYLSQIEKYNCCTDRLARLMVAHNEFHGLSSHVDNLCMSRECKVYYMVRKAQRDQTNVAEVRAPSPPPKAAPLPSRSAAACLDLV